MVKDNNQEGAIPVLFSLLAFKRIADRHQTLFLTSTNVSGLEKPFEIDFMVFNHRHGKIECAFGEVKSAGGIIDTNDIANVKLFAEKLPLIGIKRYFAFAKAGDSFTSDEIGQFKSLQKEGAQLILLTNKEMEPHPCLS